VVTSPIASTQKTKQAVRMRELLERARAELPSTELESVSNQAIDWIQNEACQEPENRERLGVLNEPKRGNELNCLKF
jgi:hypothetical protein